jgi:hypothetical protein
MSVGAKLITPPRRGEYAREVRVLRFTFTFIFSFSFSFLSPPPLRSDSPASSSC